MIGMSLLHADRGPGMEAFWRELAADHGCAPFALQALALGADEAECTRDEATMSVMWAQAQPWWPADRAPVRAEHA